MIAENRRPGLDPAPIPLPQRPTMQTPGPHSAPAFALPPPAARLRRDAARDLAVAGALVVALAAALGAAIPLGPGYAIKAALLFAVGAWLVWRPGPQACRAGLAVVALFTLLASAVVFWIAVRRAAPAAATGNAGNRPH